MKINILILGFSLFLLLSCGDDKPGNTAPSKPISLNGANYTCEVLRPTLSWSCSDIDNDKLTFTLKIGENATNLTEIASNLSGTDYTFANELNKSTKYYWQIIVSDGKEETIGDVWSFSTVGEPKTSIVPSTPIIISPKTNVKTGNIDFIWSTVVDDKGMENISFILNINGEETTLTDVTTKTLPLKAGECVWYVTAYDEDGNGSESEHIKINVE